MKYRRIRNPIVPSSKVNPTGTTNLLVKADSQIKAKYASIEPAILAMFNAIPFYAINADGVYGFTPEQSTQLAYQIGLILDQELADGEYNTNWYATYDYQAAALGTVQSVTNLTALSEVYAASRPLSIVMSSPAFLNRVAFAQQKSYAHWTGLAQSTKADLVQLITSYIRDGKNPKAVAADISKRLGVSMSKARSYAQTDLTDTLRQARWAEAEAAEEDLGLEIRLLWTSALKATTRPWHASRHGKTYTTQQVRDFYASGSERYNCMCSAVECLVENGQPVLTQKLKDAMTAELKVWDKSHD